MCRESSHERRPTRCGPAGRVRVLFGCTGWPSGILEVASWAKHRQLAEAVIVPLGPSDDAAGDPIAALGEPFARKLMDFRPHVVGFRLEGGGFDHLKRCIAAARVLGDAEIVIGGPTATSHPREVLEETGADYVFVGEAEESFARFLRLAWRRNSKDRQPEIPGLAYRYGGRTCVNVLGGPGNTLRGPGNTVRPVADVELIAANRLDWSILEHFDDEFDSLYFTGGRGCPGACTFCARLHGNHVRNKSARQLLEEIEAADAKVADGTLRVSRWKLFGHVDDPALKDRKVAWAAVYDEDFFLDRPRAIEFFRLWARSPLHRRYRISLQTNPRSLLADGDRVHGELLNWIDRLKPMVQLGAESFHDELLRRWNKRHTVPQLLAVLDALDRTRQDYTVFQLLSDFDTTPEELVETLRLLILHAFRHRRMRIASSPFTIPLYDSATRRLLEYGGRLPPGRVRHFTDYERPQPGWMDPLAAELAEAADAELQFALNPEHRDGSLLRAFEVVLARLREHVKRESRLRHLVGRAERAFAQIQDARFQPIVR